ncbi:MULTISPECIES: class I SAM-dependent DNA methyltransferase [Bradyrhizobium]|uniref:class I SAM-dependent DNA methyltransferase n=1 Tax=Bradyrhizobium TaxID=374 RepID=UPI000487AE5E|nr:MULTISPECIES: class I SAM-dependent methyltransferase [Bradyrhizobium]MBR1003585.1 methyltransferase domain-containing protein [Bradyrhizobium liaoningense]MCP1749169.1 SAM-dependent methyltransferase [Bradyrhizobium japonicum]MCP1855179.1 SAM-dependent methyltransferase [Bradyrhizobium japonicum]MCP1898072.1 SAM-dependent methyltransferase [Bradyrhizobium japonicum]MCW2330995.1 SAM-dependent methyltransferase [Bradyrhizobium japonicum]
MLLINPFDLLKRDSVSAVLVDRRARSAQIAAARASLEIKATWTMLAPLSGHPIHAALLSPDVAPPDFKLPRRIETCSGSYTRLLDRFYVPDDAGPEVTSALFDAIAVHYDDLTDCGTNLAVCRRLLDEVSGHSGSGNRILDFGCGTGVAVLAASEPDLQHLRLVGTDASPAMLELARRRGEETLHFQTWWGTPAGSFDGAIAAFVLHYGVPDEHLSLIASQLRDGAIFAANLFKAPSALMDRIVRACTQGGLKLRSVEQLDATAGENLLLIFEKTPGAGG